MGLDRECSDSILISKSNGPPEWTEALPSEGTLPPAEIMVWVCLAILFAFSLATLAYPMARAFHRFDFNYNEGWNVYNAQAAMQHRPLYYPKYGWTTVNYPFLSFYLVGYMSHFNGDYLLTGRLLSLVALLVSCVLVGLIVKNMTGGRGPAVFASVFCLGLFCSVAGSSVAANDPQLLPFPFVLFGLWVYLQADPSTLRVAGITSLFVLAGNIKQNLLAAPISVFCDLFKSSSSKAVRFMLFGIFFLALSIAVNVLAGGAYFISHLLTPRGYSFAHLRDLFLLCYSTQSLPLALCFFWSVWQRKNRKARVISFYFFSSLLIGAAFGGGAGVWQSTYFDNIFAMSIIMGACLDLLWKAPIPSLGKGGRGRFLVPVLLYSSVVFMFAPWAVNWSALFSSFAETQRQYDAEVSFLVARPGPAICESLLLCYDAGKPYILDPFNSARLVRLGKLNSSEIVQQIAEHKYGAIQTQAPATLKRDERFPDDVMEAINRYYVEALKHPFCVIYVPRVEPWSAASVP
ncbi:MAG: hypothetical protein P4N24_08960 [Acidobacteriota bacterium]|nr:hypothetical protein [Acidobacteriota bacterium]